MTYYRKNLPHWQPEGTAIFLTWRLHGSILVFKESRYGTPEAGRDFVVADRILDCADHGPVWLKDPRVANLVIKSFLYGDEKLNRYTLHAYVVMANHVHLLFSPKIALGEITRDLKGFPARQANEILGRKGKLFWKRESYDHWVRTPKEFRKIVQYIEWNPVKAGIVDDPINYPWSSARRRIAREHETCDRHHAGRWLGP